MGRYNVFYADAKCSKCKRTDSISFQADIGYLDWISFEIGDESFKDKGSSKKKLVYPDPDIELDKAFWAYGVGECKYCGNDIYAKIYIDQGIFKRIEVIPEPENMEGWSYSNIAEKPPLSE